MASKAGITVAIKGEIDDLEAKISQSKEIINDATKSIISENNKLIASQEALIRIKKSKRKTYKRRTAKSSSCKSRTSTL